MDQERLGPSYFFISLVPVPLNSLVWYVPSLRYTRGLGWRMHCGVEVNESSTNKKHIIKRWVEPEDREVPERSSNVPLLTCHTYVGELDRSRDFLSSLINFLF